MKKIIFMENFDRFPDTANNSTVRMNLEAAVDLYTPVLEDFLLPAYTLSSAYSSKTGYIGKLTVDGREYRGYVESAGSYYGHVSLRYPKKAGGDRYRIWYGFRMASTAFKANTALVAGYATTLPVNTAGVGVGSYYVEICVDLAQKKFFCYRNKTFTGSIDMGNELSYMSSGSSAGALNIGRMNQYGTSPVTGLMVTTDIYIATETWGADEEAPVMEPFGPVRVESCPVAKVDADKFLTNNESKEAAVRYTALPEKGKVNPDPLYTDSDSSVGKFTFTQPTSTKAPLAVQVMCGVERGVSSNGKAVIAINDGTKQVEMMNRVPSLSTDTLIPPVLQVLNTTLDGQPLTKDYTDKLTVNVHSEEG